MFIYSHRRVLLPSKNGSRRHLVPKDFIGEIPGWAAETDYFRELVRDGKISLPESHKDKDIEATEETPSVKGSESKRRKKEE